MKLLADKSRFVPVMEQLQSVKKTDLESWAQTFGIKALIDPVFPKHYIHSLTMATHNNVLLGKRDWLGRRI